MKKIFVGYDGTESSVRALEFALSTLQGDGAPQSVEVHLAYVVEKLHGIADPVPEEVVDSLRRAGEEILSNGARLVRKQLENPVIHLEFGSPPEKLLELADRIIPDLVVIGIAKHHASERILGTVSALFFRTRRYAVLGVP